MISGMSGPGHLVVQKESAHGAPMTPELVQAWARDIATGEPRHILELGPEQGGARSGCECPSCGLPLLAINAAKAVFLRRPHFRHPGGAKRDECLVLAARAAAMRHFQQVGWIELPRRRVSARATGLSGEAHEAWVEQPAERVRIADVDFHDRAVALLTLDDGRQLRVELTGTLEASAGAVLTLDANGHPVPTILLAIEDPSLAGMAPDALRHRLTLLPDALCWRSHWRDVDLADQAAAAVRGKLLFYFDEVPDGLALPADLDPALKRQTVLHHEVMRLLSEAQMLHVPGWEVYVEAMLPDGRVACREDGTDPDWLNLEAVTLEQRFGNIVPDVTCEADAVEGGPTIRPLFIEVTVTNAVTEERLQRIRAAGQHTLEINLSLAGGRVDQQTLRRLVVNELALKRWLHHPDQARRSAALEDELATEVAAARTAADRQAQLRALPLSNLASRYLDAVLQVANAEAAEDPHGHTQPLAAAETRSAQVALAEVVNALGARGYPEAGDSKLIGVRGMVASLLSIWFARPVGYRVETVGDVLTAIEQSQGVPLEDTSIYLIAVRAYQPPLSQEQQDRAKAWAGKVRDSLKRGELTYQRDPKYDRFLSVIFPEMAPMLAKPGGKRRLDDELPGHHNRSGPKRGAPPAPRQTTVLDQGAVAVGLRRRYMDTPPGEHWLRGRDLDAWKQANPESARIWFGDEGGRLNPPKDPP